MTKSMSVCVYCGSQPGSHPAHMNIAQEVGIFLAQNDISLVYGGGTNGIMGQVASATKHAGGHVTGIIPQFLLEHEAKHQPELFCDEIIVTENMHERKQKMFESSDAFLALPGGIGTLEELVEILTWAQLERHSKPVGVMNIEDFWSPLFELLDHMKAEGFLHSASRAVPQVLKDVDHLRGFLDI